MQSGFGRQASRPLNPDLENTMDPDPDGRIAATSYPTLHFSLSPHSFARSLAFI